jgi:hypothetical protein
MMLFLAPDVAKEVSECHSKYGTNKRRTRCINGSIHSSFKLAVLPERRRRSSRTSRVLDTLYMTDILPCCIVRKFEGFFSSESIPNESGFLNIILPISCHIFCDKIPETLLFEEISRSMTQRSCRCTGT